VGREATPNRDRRQRQLFGNDSWTVSVRSGPLSARQKDGFGLIINNRLIKLPTRLIKTPGLRDGNLAVLVSVLDFAWSGEVVFASQFDEFPQERGLQADRCPGQTLSVPR
jgi:hypothetical protein